MAISITRKWIWQVKKNLSQNWLTKCSVHFKVLLFLNIITFFQFVSTHKNHRNLTWLPPLIISNQLISILDSSSTVAYKGKKSASKSTAYMCVTNVGVQGRGRVFKCNILMQCQTILRRKYDLDTQTKSWAMKIYVLHHHWIESVCILR